MNVIEKYQPILISIIHRYLPQARIYLYGSRATRHERPGSDIDIALDNGSVIDTRILGNILEEMDQTNIPVLIDLIDVYTVPSSFLSAIKKNWIPWTV